MMVGAGVVVRNNTETALVHFAQFPPVEMFHKASSGEFEKKNCIEYRLASNGDLGLEVTNKNRCERCD